MTRIGIIDSGISNVGSVHNAFAYLGVDTQIVLRPADLAACSHVVLPGDGSFPAGMRSLRETGLDDAVRDAARRGLPLLGVCLGMQLFADAGEEFEPTPGLGLMTGRVVAMQPGDPRLPVPQIGWNEVHFYRETELSAGLGPRALFYFMQSYAFADPTASSVAATCDYGGPIVAVVEQENVCGVQFHPEKSQRAGLRLLANFAGIA